MSEAISTCPRCGSHEIVFDEEKHEFVCKSCGLVVSDYIVDYGYEFRIYDNRQVLPRTSGNYTNRIHDHGIGGTKLGGGYRGEKWRKIRRAQRKTRVNKDERIVEKALRHLNDLIRLLDPPRYVNETAGQILREAVKGKNYKEKTLRQIAAASIYLAYKINGIPKSIRIFSKKVGIQIGKLWKAERIIHENIPGINLKLKRDDPRYFIPYLVQQLGLSQNVMRLAETIATYAFEKGLTNGKSALGVATASVYISSILLNEKKTQLEIAEKAEVTDVTIRNRYDDIVRNFDIVVEL